MKSTSFKSSNDPNVNDTPSSWSSEESTFIVKRPNKVMFEEPQDIQKCNKESLLDQISSLNKDYLPNVNSRQSHLTYTNPKVWETYQ